jgi:CheY-like chemotaxis protein
LAGRDGGRARLGRQARTMSEGSTEAPVRVLVVEDDEAVRRVAALTLRAAGMEVLQATDGETAVELFRERADEIDCVLLDLGLPGISGEEVFDELLKIRGDARVVVATGSIDEAVLDGLRARGARGVVYKPSSIDVIRDTVLEAIGRR